MAQVLNLSPPAPTKSKSFLLSSDSSRSTYQSWSSLQRNLQCKGRFLCLFSDNKREEEARKASLTVLGIVLIYLLVAKGELLLSVILNPLLYALRGTRNGLSFITSKILKITNSGNPSNFDGTLKKEAYQRPSAKENVMRKWGTD